MRQLWFAGVHPDIRAGYRELKGAFPNACCGNHKQGKPAGAMINHIVLGKARKDRRREYHPSDHSA
jgi:hypothetical protein